MSVFTNLFIVGFGGAIGAVCRFYLSQALNGTDNRLDFPSSTLVANILGCLCLGIVLALVEKNALGEPYRLFLAVGILGALTTFSTFNWEIVVMLREGETLKAFLYPVLSIAVGLVACILGWKIASS